MFVKEKRKRDVGKRSTGPLMDQIPRVFKQCSIDGLYRLLRMLDQYVCNVTDLAEEFGSRTQARKYLKMALGLQLARVAWASRTGGFEGAGPQMLIYHITRPVGESWLRRLEQYNEERIVAGQIIQRFPRRPKVRAYAGTGRRWSRIP